MIEYLSHDRGRKAYKAMAFIKGVDEIVVILILID